VPSVQRAVAPLGGFFAAPAESSEAAALANFVLPGDSLLAEVVFAPPGLLAIDELGIDVFGMPVVTGLFTAAGTFEIVAAGLAALFELAGELPHPMAIASSAKMAMISKDLVFIQLFLSNWRRGPRIPSK